MLDKVTWTGGNYTSYVYDAAGAKRRVIHQTGSVTKTTGYCGNVIYENGVLKCILTDEGYIAYTGSTPVYYYYLRDHLGNNRVVINSSGAVQQVNHYYAFGGLFGQLAPDVQRFKYNGKELDTANGLDLYDYHARQMDAALGRFTTVDPLAEKYYSVSPYGYVANNPMKNIDVNGDSISLSALQSLDQSIGTNCTQQVIDDLQSQTGLTLSVDANGKLIYNMDSNGQAIISTVKDSNGNLVQQGSATARDLIINSINNSDIVDVIPAYRSGVVPGTNEIRVSYNQINSLINGTIGLDTRTMGWGMTLMHELHHTQVGGGLRDAPYNPGPAVTQMNIIRAELNALGGNYGQRMDYYGRPIGLYDYLPFDVGSQRLINNSIVPLRGEKFIKIK